MYRLQVRSQNGNLTGTCAPNIHIFTVEANHNTLHMTLLYYAVSNAMRLWRWLWLRLYVSLFAFFFFLFLFYALVYAVHVALLHTCLVQPLCVRALCGSLLWMRHTSVCSLCSINNNHEIHVLRSTVRCSLFLFIYSFRIKILALAVAVTRDIYWRYHASLFVYHRFRVQNRHTSCGCCTLINEFSVTALRACKKTNEWNFFRFLWIAMRRRSVYLLFEKLNLSLPKYSGLQSTSLFLCCLIALWLFENITAVIILLVAESDKNCSL